MWSDELENVTITASSGALGLGPELVRRGLCHADPAQGPRCWLNPKKMTERLPEL